MTSSEQKRLEANKRAKAHYQANKERKKAYQKRYRIENPEVLKNWRENNPDKVKTQQLQYYKDNKEHLVKYSREYREENHDKHLAAVKDHYKRNKEKIIPKNVKRIIERLKVDEKFKTIHSIRTIQRLAFKKYSRNGKILPSKKYGIDHERIFRYMGPCPGDRGEWHIDHIIPLCIFNLDHEEEVKNAFRPSNHRWIKKGDNLSKSIYSPLKFFLEMKE